MSRKFEINRDPSIVLDFLDQIQAAADSEKEALGFWPDKIYRQQINQRKLFLLVNAEEDRKQYAGHLLFGGVFPQLKIFQTVIHSEFRRQSCGTLLIRSLISYGEEENYSSIVANVGDDLHQANSFYQKNGFSILRTKQGGVARGRKILVRSLALNSRDLISLIESRRILNLKFKNRDSSAPLYVIDINVLLDLVRERPRTGLAEILFGAALAHDIRIAVTDEFFVELERNSNDLQNDPLLKIARRFPRLPALKTEHVESLIGKVREIIFPSRTDAEFSARDKSDVAHVAYAVAAEVSGYITSDEKVLQSRNKLWERYQLDVVSLNEFTELLELPQEPLAQASIPSINFIVDARIDLGAALAIVPEKESVTQFIGSEGGAPYIRVVRSGSQYLGVSILRNHLAVKDSSKLYVWVSADSPVSSTVADYLLSDACRFASSDHVAMVEMLTFPSHATVRRVALENGFQETSKHGVIAKISLGRPVLENTWEGIVRRIGRVTELDLPAQVPEFRVDTNVDVRIFKSTTRVSLGDLERLFSPSLFVLEGRAGVLVPITKEYSTNLLGTDKQFSFLSRPEASFLSRRTYFNSINAIKAMKKESIIIFYESVRSDGSGMAVAAARIVDVASLQKDQITEATTRSGVIEDFDSISKSDRILATTFDNLLAFPKPVSKEHLRSIGAAKKNFQIATELSYQQIKSIFELGWHDV